MAQDDRILQDDNPGGHILRQMTRRAMPAPDAPGEATNDGGARMLRVGFARAAVAALGLSVVVSKVAEDSVRLDDLLDGLPPDQLMFQVQVADRPLGLVQVDTELSAVVIEMSTMGRVGAAAATPRLVTGTDAAMVHPLLATFLRLVPEDGPGTDLAKWMAGTAPGPRVRDARAAGLILAEAEYRVIRLTIDIPGTDRHGEMMLALPAFRGKPHNAPVDTRAADWTVTFHDAVLSAPAELHAVLHRMQMSLRQVDGFEVGQVLALPGVGVGSVRIEGPGGRMVATARLGQVAGLRAVRIERPTPPQMAEARPLSGVTPATHRMTALAS